MRRSFLIPLVLIMLACPALAIEQGQWRMRDQAYPDFQATCALLRVDPGVRQSSGTWTETKCASELLRRAKRAYMRAHVRAVARQTVDNADVNEANRLDGNHPPAFTPAFCGDGNADTEFDEVCDDGNDLDGDGCETDCTITP